MEEVKTVRSVIKLLIDESGGMYTAYCVPVDYANAPFEYKNVINVSLVLVPPVHDFFRYTGNCVTTSLSESGYKYSVPEIVSNDADEIALHIIPVADLETPEAMEQMIRRLAYVLRTNPGKLRMFGAISVPNFSDRTDARIESEDPEAVDDDVHDIAEVGMGAFILHKRWNREALLSYLKGTFDGDAQELLKVRPDVLEKALDLLVSGEALLYNKEANCYIRRVV